MMSCQEKSRPTTLNTGYVSCISQVRPSSRMMRNTSASDSPIWRARLASWGEQRDTSTEMNTMLSMPSTISSAVKVTSAAQAFGSVESSSIRTSQQASPEEVQRDDTQCGCDPRSGHHVAQQCDAGEHGPNAEQRDVDETAAPDAERMHERNGQEGA